MPFALAEVSVQVLEGEVRHFVWEENTLQLLVITTGTVPQFRVLTWNQVFLVRRCFVLQL